MVWKEKKRCHGFIIIRGKKDSSSTQLATRKMKTKINYTHCLNTGQRTMRRIIAAALSAPQQAIDLINENDTRCQSPRQGEDCLGILFTFTQPFVLHA